MEESPPSKWRNYQDCGRQGKTYYFCTHHNAWTLHKPSECRLGDNATSNENASNSNESTFASALATIEAESQEWLPWGSIRWRGCLYWLILGFQKFHFLFYTLSLMLLTDNMVEYLSSLSIMVLTITFCCIIFNNIEELYVQKLIVYPQTYTWKITPTRTYL